MVEADDVGRARIWRTLRIWGLAFAIFVLLSLGGGFLLGSLHSHDLFEPRDMFVLGVFALCVAACGWLLRRELRKPNAEEPLLPSERMNRNHLVGSGALGGICAILMVSMGGGGFSNGPLPVGVAILLALMIGVVVPVASFFWHRIIDEQEEAAYRSGALAGIYLYGIGSPVWWILWRGGLVPAPNGIAIYIAVTFTVLGFWLWRKYR